MPTVRRRRWLILRLAALGGAGMFLGPAGWRGIDSGAVGTAVSYAALWLLPIHLFRHFEEAFFVIATRLRSGYREAMDLDERNR